MDTNHSSKVVRVAMYDVWNSLLPFNMASIYNSCNITDSNASITLDFLFLIVFVDCIPMAIAEVMSVLRIDTQSVASYMRLSFLFSLILLSYAA